jgi:flagellar biosynthetic protein FliR
LQLADLLTQDNAIIFFLLFSRISGVIAFFPFFSHMSIPVPVKTALAFYLTILFFPITTLNNIPYEIGNIAFYIVSEFMLGFIAALILNFVFAALGLAGNQISMIMGFSMASVMDPTTGTNTPIIGQILTLIAILILLTFNGHHLMLLFLSQSIDHIQLGGFYPESFMWDYINASVRHMFMMGLIIAFPFIALSILSDVIFGMLMKTMPQFNLLVVGFPIKIFLSIMVMISVLSAMMGLFKEDFLQAFEYLKHLI